MTTKFQPELVQATLNDYPVVQNMARFYAYDISRNCGFISDDWAFLPDGLYECYDFKNYFEDHPIRHVLTFTQKTDVYRTLSSHL